MSQTISLNYLSGIDPFTFSGELKPPSNFFPKIQIFFSKFSIAKAFFLPIRVRRSPMKNLILALNQANLSPNGIETVLTEMEVWIDSKVLRSEQNLMIETIAPLKRETDGIRNEIRFLAETMKQGFEKSDQKQDFTRKHLEMQIDSSRKNLELQIASSRENLETQIRANDKQLGLVQKLLWLVLTLVLGLFAKAVHLV
jgi:hypothetical protein